MNRVDVLASQLEIDGDVAVLRLDAPPLNTLGFATRKRIMAGLAQAEANPAVKVIVITGAGRAFSAGADIKEFSEMGKMDLPLLPEVIDRIEASPKVVVAAVNGMAMGGGCEVALGCHYRVMSAKAIFALPEIKLGIIPGAGGTQRLPRLCGPQFAVQMCCTGGNIRPAAALKNGLVDGVVGATEDVVAAAAKLGRAAVAKNAAPRRTSAMTAKLGNALTNFVLFRAARAQVAKATPSGMVSPLRALDAVQAACSVPSFKAGMAFEMKTFMALAKSPQAAAMQHFFTSERRALKIPGLEQQAPRKVKSVGVVGGGTMGGGIAMCFLNIGVPVVLIETSAERKGFCEANIAGTYGVTVKKGRLSKEKYAQRMALLTVVVNDYAALQDVDYVIEAVFENMALKKEIFAKLEACCKPTCVLASNTSTLDIDEIASSTKSPHRVIGAHFFSPANVMKLLEFIRGKDTDAATIATSMAVGKAIRKAPVMVGNCFGFVSNRMIMKGGFQNLALLEEGALPVQIDKVIKGFGFPMGTFAMGDLAGIDVSYKIALGMPKHLVPAKDVAAVQRQLYEMGRYGQKTGRGWYIYTKEKPRAPVFDPAVDKLVIANSAKKGIARRTVEKREILERYLYAMINEAAEILREGYAIRPSDIDIVFIYGFGFPPYAGGPCHYADHVGLPKVVDAIKRYNATLGGDTFPAPSALLLDMVAKGTNFATLNK
jgi:3-hydroxyacyl-CoA dehydrogenase